MIIYLAPKVTDRSPCSLPAALRKRQKGCLFEIAPGRVYRSRSLSKSEVGSYPAISPLPRRISPTGGILSVALSILVPLKFLSGFKFRGLPGPVFPGVRTFLTLLFAKAARSSGRMLTFDYFGKVPTKREKKKDSLEILACPLHISIQEHWS